MTQTKVRSYRDLLVWQGAIELIEAVYHATESFPKRETYGLTAQIRRAAVSIPSNIAEGHGRLGPREYLHHLSIANGSLMEVETQIVVARRLGYLREEAESALQVRTREIGRMTAGLIRALQIRTTRGANRSQTPRLLAPDP